jgi:VanZ family protein
LLTLRFPKFWSVFGWLLVVTVIVGSLIPGPLIAQAVDISDKLQHAGAYFLLMVWFAGFYRRALYPVIAAVLMGLGIGLDLLQGLTETRSFDWHDIAMNSVGVVLGFAASLFLLGGWCQRVEQRLLS